MVGSANPETMEQFLEDDDLVIMGNRYDAQICALESNASCIVIAGSPQVPENDCKNGRGEALRTDHNGLRYLYSSPSDQPEHANQILYAPGTVGHF